MAGTVAGGPRCGMPQRGELGVVVRLAKQLGASLLLADNGGRSPWYAGRVSG